MRKSFHRVLDICPLFRLIERHFVCQEILEKFVKLWKYVLGREFAVQRSQFIQTAWDDYVPIIGKQGEIRL